MRPTAQSQREERAMPAQAAIRPLKPRDIKRELEKEGIEGKQRTARNYMLLTLVLEATTKDRKPQMLDAITVPRFRKPAYIDPFARERSQSDAARTPQFKTPQNRPPREIPMSSTLTRLPQSTTSASSSSTPATYPALKSHARLPANAPPSSPSPIARQSTARQSTAVAPPKSNPLSAKLVADEIARLNDQLRDTRRELGRREIAQKGLSERLCALQELLAGITEEFYNHIAAANAFQEETNAFKKSMTNQIKTLTNQVTNWAPTAGDGNKKRKRETDEEEAAAAGASATQRPKLGRNANHSVSK